MGSTMISRAVLLALCCACAVALTPLSAAGDDNDCALYLSGPGRTSAYDYSLNLLKGNFGYEGQHTCVTYDAVNQAYLEARNRILVSQPKGDWKPEDFASVGELILDISINLARRYGLTYEEIEKGLPLIDTSRTLIREVCPPVFSHVECRAGKYRRLDGLCNNLQHPTWGAINAPFQRLIGPLFADGINAPRISHTGRDLPLSRVVSRTMHPDDGFHDHAGTVMVIAWGQFMDHDYTLTGTPLDPRNRNDPEECCNRPPHLKHPYCNEIRIPDDDYFYRLFNVKCIDFVRGFPSPRPGCRLGSRVPFNTLTGAIDGNTVYGVTDKFSRKLRTGFGGLLRMNPVFKEYGLKDLLPLKLDIPDEGCTRPNKNMYCFEAGEIRVNEQLVLTVMHTLMAREHNRVAGALGAVNPHWDDETLFQEARRINIAEIQHITYNEFLPILLGKDVMEKFGLVLEKQDYWDGYDEHVNPDVLASFAAAAYRFGHSLLPTAVERWSKAHKFIASKRLSDLIRRPYDLYRAGVLDEYVMGLMNQVAQAMDDSITQEVTNHLFKKVGARFGMDLVSFNMQRGREFGLPGYMEFRKFCGLSGADTFQDLFGAMSNDTVRKYETIFEHPIDVDLWSGGVSERPLPGSMLGPTFACVIATQFSYSRRGDRFWFELPNQPSSFTPEQLTEIRKARLARVICDNTDIIDTVQLYPMVLPDHELNPRVPCRSGILPTIDFTKWAEPAPFHSAKQFMTDAYIPAKNETDCEEQVEKVIDNISATVPTVPVAPVPTVPVAQHTECNETADPNAAQSSVLNTHSTNNNTTTNNSPTTIQDCAHNTEDTQATNCTETPVNSPEIRDGDTVLKYVYKNDENPNLPEKSKGHAKNSLKRKKRAVNSYKDNARYAESVPLIVNYKTSHSPDQGEKPFERIRDVIKNSHLADFNIETLHGDTQSRKNSENIKEPPKREYFKPKVIPKLREISEENINREEFKDNRRNNKRFKDSKDSGEGSTYNDQRRESEHNRNSKPYGQREDSRDRTDYKPRDEPPRNRDSKPYQEDEENDDGEDYNVSRKEPLEERERKPYRESEENTDRSDHREKQPIRESDRKPYRESDESTERSVHIPSQKEPVRERDQKPNRNSDESTERDEYKDRKEPLRERDTKPYRESDESTEKSYYRDSKKEPVQERGRKPYLESDENSEKGDYRNSRREPIRERDSTPYRESDESSERSDYRDRNEPLRERNNKPYRESEESTERSNYRNSRKESDEARDSKPYRESEESTEKGDYRDSRKEPHRERNSKPYRESDESDERSDTREHDSKPYRESDESSDNGEYRDTKRENRDEENRKPYRESKSGGKNAYRENHREPHSDRRSYESDEKDYPRNKAPYSSPPKDSNESRDIEQSDETRYPRRGYTRNNKEPYTAPSKDSRESRESERSEESSYPKRSDSREDGNYYNTENDKLPYIKPRSESTESNGNANSSYQKEPTSGPTSTEKDYYKSNSNSNLRQPPPYNDGSDEEEEIIAIMRKKNRKIHDKPLNEYNSEIKDQPITSTPIKLKDVDLDDFSYERIQVNDKGVVEPSKETHENYDTDTQVEIVPITTAIPVVVKENVEQYSRSIESIDTPSSAEINDDNNPQIHINDGEIKPVVEINRDSIELRDENSKEALKNSPDNEDTSLESLLGVKITDSDDANVKPILKHEPKQKGDVKQQFERIPLNYNHNQKDHNHNEKESSIKPEENKSESDDEDTTQNQGTLDILTPKDHSYDENLNIKFDDLAIKLPEINLPKDILAYTYEDPPYEKQKDEEKPKFYQYNDEYTEEKPREQKNRDDEDYDDRPHDKYSGYYGNNKKKDDYTKKQQDNDDDLHHIYPSYYADDKKKDDYTKKQKEEDEEHEGENDDLYEKFVRERFGKRGSFEKRSEKIQELPIRPIKANAKLFNTIQQVLKKTEDVQKQAEKSGDPNAAYMWTLEYGQKL